MKHKYSLQDLQDAVNTSYSLRQVLNKLGLKEAGGNYTTLKNRISEYNINTDHFTGQGHLSGKTHNYKTKPLEEYLIIGSNIQSYKLKLRLIKEGIKESKCELCGITEWRGQPAPLELDHINGNPKDNRLENLRVICPNCHSQTDTYRGKNIKK